MLEQEGPLPRAVLCPTLWLVVLGPLLALAWQILVIRPRLSAAANGPVPRRTLERARVAGLAGPVAAALAVAGHLVWLLVRTRGHGALYDHVVRGARLPGLEAPFDLWMDTRAAVACGLASAVAVAVAVVLARSRHAERGWTRWAWLELALLGALVAFLADGFALAAMGWALAGAAGAWLHGWRDVKSGVEASSWVAVSLSAMLLGGALLFWGMGGGWDAEGYAPDTAELFAVLRAGGDSTDATLTMTSPPGARVYLDDARDTTLRAPFVRAPMTAGMHVVRVGARDAGGTPSTTVITPAAGDDVAFVPLGPTLSFHAMADQLAVPDSGAETVPRRKLEARAAPGGIGVVALAILALLAATAAASTLRAAPRAPRPLMAMSVVASPAALGAYLLVRMDFLFDSAKNAGGVVALFGAALFLMAVLDALPFFGLARGVVFSARVPAALTCIALGLRGTTAALVVMGVVGLASAALQLFAARRSVSLEPPEDARSRESLLVSVPEAFGDLLVSMERWVLGAVADAIGGVVRIAAWTVATADRHVVSSPAYRLAGIAARGSRAVEPLTGWALARVAWALLVAVGIAVLLHALWPGG